MTGVNGRHFVLAVLLLGSLALNAVPLWWGLPGDGDRTWAFDEIPPGDTGDTVESRHQGRYPPLHYYLLRLVYSPLRWLADAGALKLDARDQLTALQLIGRALSVLLATATIWLVYRTGRLLLAPAAALLAAVVAALVVPFVFYAKTINLESPYVFWFSASVFFFVQVQRRHRLRDYLAFATAMTAAVCTKDQAYALYGLVPAVLLADLHLHLGRSLRSPRQLAKTLLDRRLLLAALTAVMLFVLIHNLIFDWQGFLRHIWIMTHRASAPAQMFEHTLVGHLAMLSLAVKHLAFSLGWPLLVAAAIGIALAVRDRRWHLLSLLVFPLSYYLLFMVPILYHRVRFFVPVCVVLAFFAAQTLWRLGRLPGRLRPVGWLGVALILVLAAVRPVSLDLEMLFDSRYSVEEWLQRSENQSTRVAVIGTHSQRLPRGRGIRKLQKAAEGGGSYLRDLDADILVINEQEANLPLEKDFFEQLTSGALNYRVLFRRRFESWPYNLDRSEVSTNLVSVNPPITVLERVAAWGLSDNEVWQRLLALREGRDLDGWQELAEAIASAGPSRERNGLGTETVTFGLSSDGWTRRTLPGAVVIGNSGPLPLYPTLALACGAQSESLPLTAFVSDGLGTETVRFESSGRLVVELSPVPPGTRRMYLVYADRDWSPKGKDRRRLGVNVRRGEDRANGA